MEYWGIGFRNDHTPPLGNLCFILIRSSKHIRPTNFRDIGRHEKNRMTITVAPAWVCAIAKQLVERMGGAIGVSSELRRGGSFWFSLPLGDEDHALPA